MKTPLMTLAALAVTCTISAQSFNLDLFQVDIQNEESVNTKHSEFGMVKSVGGKYMFTSDRNKFSTKNVFLDDSSYKMYTCDLKSPYSKVRPMAVNYNSNSNNGPATPVNNNVFYFTSTNKKATLNWKEATKTNMLTINKATLIDGKWKVEVIKEFKSKKYSFGQPSISKDGKTLFFVSNMEGGQGEADLYVSYRIDEGWTEPANLGSTVNTDQKDMYPYIHESGILFFASTGHDGFGGLDIFMTYKTDEGWITPENLGSPINTADDDFSLYMDKYLESGYFSSNREGGFGGDDIYRLSLTSIENTSPELSQLEHESVEQDVEEPHNPTISAKSKPITTIDAIDASASLQR